MVTILHAHSKFILETIPSSLRMVEIDAALITHAWKECGNATVIARGNFSMQLLLKII
jgi:hypothetical protein